MANIISLSAFILGCILLTRAEPPVNSFSGISTDGNGFELNSNIINGAYMAGKEGHRENTDFYAAAGSSGHSLTGSRTQGNLEDSLRSTSYSGFSPSTHNTPFATYTSSGSRDSLATSPYFVNNVAQSSFDSYASTGTNGDSNFEAYTQGSDQSGADFNQFSSGKHKTPSYMRYSGVDSLSGATSSSASYPDLGSTLGTESSSFRGDYTSGDAFRSHSQPAGFMDAADQTFNREASNLFNGQSTDYSYGKAKENGYGAQGAGKFTNDVYSMHSDGRYVRGSHSGVPTRDYAAAMFSVNAASAPVAGTRGSTYGGGKFSKLNKYVTDYTPGGGFNYLPKEQDVDYLLANYGKGSGKLGTIRESRPAAYGAQPSYPAGPYLSKIMSSYKSKPSFVSTYPSTSPVGYSTMTGLHSSFSGNSYGDGPLLRRYRSSSYMPGHAAYPGYY